MARATADNSKVISSDKEWAVLIRALGNSKFDPKFPKPGDLLATAVEEARRVHGVGEDLHYDDDVEALPEAERLATTLRNMDYPHAWAVILTVRWYMENYNKMKGKRIEANAQWWTMRYRDKWIEDSMGSRSAAK
jgi:hypothetical protein